MTTEYTGYTQLSDEQAAALYEGRLGADDFNENAYVYYKNDAFRIHDGQFVRISHTPIENQWESTITPKDIYQTMTIDMLQDRTSKVKLVRGVYGSGKDHLMFNQALQYVEEGLFDKIVFVRPNVTLANVPQIGYLPNGIEEKLAWTLAPLYDKVGGEDGVMQLTSKHILEMVPLLFIRGRSFENALVYVTEAQNIDSEIAKVLLGRIGDHSELWLNGDSHQTDNRLFDKDNGLTKMVDRLKGNKLFAYCYLPNTHRSDVANLANLLDES